MKKLLTHTILHKVDPAKGTMVEVPCYEDLKTGDIVPSSAFRQEKDGPKCHGGHCSGCGMELDPHTRASYRGSCDDCADEDEVVK